MLIGERLDQLIDTLKERRYDYIILDSPPLGLVSGSMELIKQVDATLYIDRYNYTHKNMFTFVNKKYRRGEIKHIIVVVNGYEEKGGRGYGYGTYVSYGNGYHDPVEKPNLWNRSKKRIRRD